MAKLEVPISIKDIDLFKELVEVIKDLHKSYEYYCYVYDPKPEEDYDEYDYMMSPIWKKYHEFIVKYTKLEEMGD